MSGFTLADLEAVIARRASAPVTESHTASLLAGGIERPARKLGEEAVETVIAALGTDRTALVKESADLLYHLLIVLKARGIALQEVMDELGSRQGQSGIQEKASRTRP